MVIVEMHSGNRVTCSLSERKTAKMAIQKDLTPSGAKKYLYYWTESGKKKKKKNFKRI